MKKLIRLILLALVFTTTTALVYDKSVYNTVSVESYGKSISSALTSIGSTTCTLTSASTYTLTQNTVIPANVAFNPQPGTRINSGGYTLTINGPFSAGLYQVFYGFGAGELTFGNNTVKEIPEAWFGGDYVVAIASKAYSNIKIGSGALSAVVSAAPNIAIGNKTLTAFTTKSAPEPFSGNIAIGEEVLNLLTEGSHNLGIGKYALRSQTIGDQNIAIGNYALSANTFGQAQTAIGVNCMANQGSMLITGTTTNGGNTVTGITPNTTGINPGNFVYGDGLPVGQAGLYVTAINSSSQITLSGNATLSKTSQLAVVSNANTAVGSAALWSNTTGENEAFGSVAMLLNTTGTRNTAFGQGALHDNVTGNDNTAMGGSDSINAAPLYYTTGSGNTGIGQAAGSKIGVGNNNTAIGFQSMDSPGSPYKFNNNNNTAIGYQAAVDYNHLNVSMQNCTFVGAKSTTEVNSLDNSTAVGYQAKFTESNAVQLGNDSVVKFGFGTHKIAWASAAPATGTWVQGDRVFNSAASVGQPKGWMCTVAGTPGTWVSEGNL